jgi:hypothetical protein
MTICPWCAQESQSNTVCDWCKRPLDNVIARPPAGARNDLDFLREESDVHRFGTVKVVAVLVGAVAIGVLGFLLLKSPPEAGAEAPLVAERPNRTGDQPRPSGPRTVYQGGTLTVQLPPNRPTFWIQNFDSKSDLISNARWSQSSPRGVAQNTVTMAQYKSSAVRLQDVDLTVVNLSKGVKRAVGKAVIVNSTDKNVLFYRFELVWGAETYVMIPLEGNSSKLQPVYARELKPGGKTAVQIVSQKITNYPDGSPTAVRLWSWLAGSPDSSVDDYQIQLGR